MFLMAHVVAPGELELFGRVAIALACGAAVGIEREFSEKPAGLRTHALVAMGAACFTVAGYAALNSIGTNVSTDPSRIAAQVVNGIGFLGAGMVIFNGDHLRGLTTAAEMWAVAAIGVLAGLGEIWGAGFATALALVVVIGGRPLESLIDRVRERRKNNREVEDEILGRPHHYEELDDDAELVGHRHAGSGR